MGEIQMDFVKDWQEEILKYIKKEGIQIPNDIRTDSLIIKYFTFLRKSKLSPLSGPFARTPGGNEQIVNKNKRGIEKSILLKFK